ALNFKVKHIIIEENFGDGMFSALFKPVLNKVHPCFVEPVKHSKQKELRIIDTLEPVMNSHKLIMDRKVVEQDLQTTEGRGTDNAVYYQLIYQMTRITKERGCLAHDDRLDALAIAVAYWVEQMSHDIDRDKSAEHNRRMKVDLDLFMKTARAPGGVAHRGLVSVGNGAGYKPSGKQKRNWMGNKR
ncbi:MAG: hypothetical protein ACRCZI_13620, partial [Cetobacterium sp.]